MNLAPNSNLKFIALLLCLFIVNQLEAQRFKYSLPGLDTLQQNFVIGGASTSLMTLGETEYILNNQLTSYWIAFHEQGENSPVLDRFRRTQFETQLTGFFGVSSSGMFDLGIQLRYSRSRIGQQASESIFKVFSGDDTEVNQPQFDPENVFDRNFSGLTYVGLRLRFKPIVDHPELLLNGGYMRATVKEEFDQTQLAADRDIADIGVTYYKSITPSIYYFASADFRALLPSSVKDEFLFNSTLSFFAIHRAFGNRLTIYPGLAYSINFKPSEFDDNSLIKVADFLFALGGVQYTFSPVFNVFLTGGLPLTLKVTHPNQKIVRASYSTFALGFNGRF